MARRDLATAFYPGRIEADPKALTAVVSGELATWVGREQVSRQRKRYRLSFRVDADRIGLLRFEELEEENETNLNNSEYPPLPAGRSAAPDSGLPLDGGTGRGEARHHSICSPRPPLSPEYERAGETSRLPFPSPGGGLAVGPKWKGTTGRMKNLTPACSRASGESGCGPRPGRRWRKNQSPR